MVDGSSTVRPSGVLLDDPGRYGLETVRVVLDREGVASVVSMSGDGAGDAWAIDAASRRAWERAGWRVITTDLSSLNEALARPRPVADRVRWIGDTPAWATVLDTGQEVSGGEVRLIGRSWVGPDPEVGVGEWAGGVRVDLAFQVVEDRERSVLDVLRTPGVIDRGPVFETPRASWWMPSGSVVVLVPVGHGEVFNVDQDAIAGDAAGERGVGEGVGGESGGGAGGGGGGGGSFGAFLGVAGGDSEGGARVAIVLRSSAPGRVGLGLAAGGAEAER